MARLKPIDLYTQELDLLLSMPKLVMKQRGWNKEQFDKRVLELKTNIEASKLGKSKRDKGSRYERAIAKIFKDKLKIDLARTPQSGGFAKKSAKADDFRGDIVCLDKGVKFKLHIECKDHKTWKLKDWILQAESDCPKGLIPVTIFHRRQTNEDGKRVQESGDYICLKLEDFLELSGDKIINRRC